jgi:hypothetical protein
LSVKLIVLPLTPVPLDVSVAESVVVPPYGPDAGWTDRDVVVPALATSAKFCTVVDPVFTVTDAPPVTYPCFDAVTV